MNIIEFCNKHDILWQPIGLQITDDHYVHGKLVKGAKIPVAVNGVLAKANDYKFPSKREEIKKRATNLVHTEYIGIYTDVVQQIDVDVPDTETYSFIKGPYFPSVKKGLPHYFVHITGYDRQEGIKAIKNADWLKGQWSYARKDTVVQNADLPIPVIPWSMIPKHKESFTKEIEEFNRLLVKLKQKIGPDCSYDQWWKIITGIYNTAYEYDIPDPKSLCHEFSAGSTKYDAAAIKAIDSLKYVHDGNKLGTLKSMIQEYRDAQEVELTDLDVANILFETHKKYVVNDSGIVYYYYNNSWTQESDKFMNHILQNSNIKTRTLRNTDIYVSSDTLSWPRYKVQMKTKFEDQKLVPPQNILDRGHVLPFQDGFWNPVEKKFYRYDEGHVSYCTYKVQRVFPINDTLVSEVREEMMSIFNDHEQLMIENFEWFARSLCRHVEDKLALSLLGSRDSGKGFIMTTLEEAFSGAIGNINSGSMLSKKAMEAEDRRLAAFCDALCKYPLSISQEVDSKYKIDGTLWRKAISGGDRVAYRCAHGRDTTKNIIGTVAFTSNIALTFDIEQSSKTLLVCNMPCKFVPVISNDGILRPYVEKLADPKIKEKFKKREYLDAFVLFVLGFYRAEKPRYPLLSAANTEIAEAEDDDPIDDAVIRKINELFITTGTDTDRIKRSDVHKLMRPHRLSDVKSILTQLGCVTKTVKGYDYYIGIKKVEIVEDLNFRD